MKKQIHRTQVSTYNKKLSDLGVDTEEWHNMAIVLSKVSGWSESYNEDGEINPHTTVVYCSANDVSIINTPYNEFDALMVKYLED